MQQVNISSNKIFQTFCSDDVRLSREMSAIHQTSQAKNIPHQPLLVKSYIQLTRQRSFFKTTLPAFQNMLVSIEEQNIVRVFHLFKINFVEA